MGFQLIIQSENSETRRTDIFKSVYQIFKYLQQLYPSQDKLSNGNIYRALNKKADIALSNGDVISVEQTEETPTRVIEKPMRSLQVTHCNVCNQSLARYTYNQHCKSQRHKTNVDHQATL